MFQFRLVLLGNTVERPIGAPALFSTLREGSALFSLSSHTVCESKIIMMIVWN